MIFGEGIFRKPRLRSNAMLRKFSAYFCGKVINVSGSNDSDKNCSLYEYYCGNYDTGTRYKEYFENAESYAVSNYPGDETMIELDEETIPIDLEQPLPRELEGKFDVVLNHTVLEHVFDAFTAFENLCKLTSDIVILVVPQSQRIHDYRRGYADYWRFTPFAVDRLFNSNGLQVLYRDTTHGFSESQYLFYIGAKQPQKWEGRFPPVKTPEEYLNPKNDGAMMTKYSFIVLRMEATVRKLASKCTELLRKGRGS